MQLFKSFRHCHNCYASVIGLALIPCTLVSETKKCLEVMYVFSLRLRRAKRVPYLFRRHVLCEPAELPLVKTVNVSLLILLIPITKKRKNEDAARWALCLPNLAEDWGLSRDWVMWYVDGQISLITDSLLLLDKNNACFWVLWEIHKLNHLNNYLNVFYGRAPHRVPWIWHCDGGLGWVFWVMLQ